MIKLVNLFTSMFVVLISVNEVYGQGNTIVVSSKEDSGASTLRQGLLDAQSGDSITFDASVFPPGSSDTIFLASPLPGLTQGNLIIDASNAGVVLNGSKIAIEEFNGMEVASNKNIIRGLCFVDFTTLIESFKPQMIIPFLEVIAYQVK